MGSQARRRDLSLNNNHQNLSSSWQEKHVSRDGKVDKPLISKANGLQAVYSHPNPIQLVIVSWDP